MADMQPYVPALNGEEIIQDVCGFVAEKLRSDCNLRQIDGYAGGYKATIKIHIEAFGLDQAVVDYEIPINETGAAQDSEGNPVDLENPETVIDTEIEIPLEEDLSEVRERSNQATPDFEIKPSIELTEEGPVAVDPPKRKYTRRLKALAQAQGGATGQLEE